MRAKKKKTIYSSPISTKRRLKSNNSFYDTKKSSKYYHGKLRQTRNKTKKVSTKPDRIRRKRKIKSVLYQIVISTIILVGFICILSMFTFSFTKVKGYSMVPTLNDSEWVFVNKLAKPRRFKLVVYKDPDSNEISVRRVIGLPGESVSFKDDQLYVNDYDVFERFIATEIKLAKSAKSVYTEDWHTNATIPKRKYLVLGDNRPYAADSREYGYIDVKEIVGVVEMRVLPIHKIHQF